MILVVSTSCPISSLAWIHEDRVLWRGEREAPRSASYAILSLLEESGIDLAQAQGFVSDVGPGSMTGVKVGVTMAKTWAFAIGTPCAGITAFDLISSSSPVVITPRRGDHWLRKPGQPPRRLAPEELGDPGLASLIEERAIPRAANALQILGSLEWIAPESLNPLYLSEPLISQAKKKLTLLEPNS